MVPAELFARIDPPSAEVYAQAEQFQQGLLMPAHSLGRLEDLGCFLAACQDQVPPKTPERCKAVVFAGDHGVTQKFEPIPPELSSIAKAERINQGIDVLNAAARTSGASLRVVDVSLDHDAWGDERVSRSCGSIDEEDAMSEEQVFRAFNIGKAIADQETDTGIDCVIAGSVGVGGDLPGAAIVGALALAEPVVLVARSSGRESFTTWKTKVSVIRDAMFRVRQLRHDPISIAQKITSPDFAAMSGFIAQSAVRKTPIILDGLVSCAAALLANKLAPGARHWFIAGQSCNNPAQKIALEVLNLTPLMDLDISSGDGTGGVVVLPLLQTAATVMQETAQKSGTN